MIIYFILGSLFAIVVYYFCQIYYQKGYQDGLRGGDTNFQRKRGRPKKHS